MSLVATCPTTTNTFNCINMSVGAYVPLSTLCEKIFDGFLYNKAAIGTRLERNLAKRKVMLEQQ